METEIYYIKGVNTMINDEICTELAEVGLDCGEMISRFMDSEDMFLKYFRKFFTAADQVVNELRAAVESGDLTEIEHKAHALKGLSGNIGLNNVFSPANKIVGNLRAGKTDEYRSDFEKLEKAYNRALEISHKI